MSGDGELLRRWQAGDQDAFSVLYNRYGGKLYTYLLSLVRSEEQAADLLQDTFLALLRRVERICKELAGRSLGAYLTVVARNLATDYLRRCKREERLKDCAARVLLVRWDGCAPPRGLSPEEASELLWALPAPQREVVVLRIYSGLRFNEISAIVGCPVNTAVSRYRYGLAKIRRLLAEPCDQGGAHDTPQRS